LCVTRYTPVFYSLSLPHTLLFCVIICTALFYSLSTVCHYLILYCSLSLYLLLFFTVYPLSVSTSHSTALCHYVHCCLLQSVPCLSGPHTLLFCVTMSTAVFYNPSLVCQYPTLYYSVSLYLPLSSTVCPLSVSTSLCTVVGHYIYCCLLQSAHCLSVSHSVLVCVTISTDVFYSLSTVCIYLTLCTSLSLYLLLSSTVSPLSVSTSHSTVLCYYIHFSLLDSPHSLSLPHNVVLYVTISTAVFYSLSTVSCYLTIYCSVSLHPLLSFTVCPLSAVTSHSIVLFHYVHCSFVQSVRSLSIPHTPFANSHPTASFLTKNTPSAALQ
jgi:hypothetical protein